MKKLIFAFVSLMLVFLFALSASAETENVALGASYTVNGIYTDADGKTYYPDENGDSLTNGVFAQSADYSDIEFVALNATSQYTAANSKISTIVLDLGKIYSIVNATVSCSNLNSAGISLPNHVYVTVSADGESWSDPIGAEYEVDTPVDGEVIKAIAEINAEIRYITYHFEHKTNWIFVDEIEAFAGDISNTEQPEESKNESSGEQSVQTPQTSKPAENDPEPVESDTDWIYLTGAAVSIAALIAAIIYRTKKK